MATIRIILRKEKTNAKGEHPVALRLADSNNKRAHFATGFNSTEQCFDTSKEGGGRFFQGRGVKTFYVERKEEDGRIKLYSNKEANEFLANMQERASKIIKKYNEDHINWGFERFRADFVNAPKRSSFLSFAKDIVEKEYTSRGRFKSAVIAKELFRSLELYDGQIESRSFQDINVKWRIRCKLTPLFRT